MRTRDMVNFDRQPTAEQFERMSFTAQVGLYELALHDNREDVIRIALANQDFRSKCPGASSAASYFAAPNSLDQAFRNALADFDRVKNLMDLFLETPSIEAFLALDDNAKAYVFLRAPAISSSVVLEIIRQDNSFTYPYQTAPVDYSSPANTNADNLIHNPFPSNDSVIESDNFINEVDQALITDDQLPFEEEYITWDDRSKITSFGIALEDADFAMIRLALTDVRLLAYPEITALRDRFYPNQDFTNEAAAREAVEYFRAHIRPNIENYSNVVQTSQHNELVLPNLSEYTVEDTLSIIAALQQYTAPIRPSLASNTAQSTTPNVATGDATARITQRQYHAAAQIGDVDTVNRFLNQRFIPASLRNWQDPQTGDTALMLAVRNRKTDVIDVLIRANVDLTLMNRNGDNAQMIAEATGQDALAGELTRLITERQAAASAEAANTATNKPASTEENANPLEARLKKIGEQHNTPEYLQDGVSGEILYSPVILEDGTAYNKPTIANLTHNPLTRVGLPPSVFTQRICSNLVGAAEDYVKRMEAEHAKKEEAAKAKLKASVESSAAVSSTTSSTDVSTQQTQARFLKPGASQSNNDDDVSSDNDDNLQGTLRR